MKAVPGARYGSYRKAEKRDRLIKEMAAQAEDSAPSADNHHSTQTRINAETRIQTFNPQRLRELYRLKPDFKVDKPIYYYTNI